MTSLQSKPFWFRFWGQSGILPVTKTVTRITGSLPHPSMPLPQAMQCGTRGSCSCSSPRGSFRFRMPTACWYPSLQGASLPLFTSVCTRIIDSMPPRSYRPCSHHVLPLALSTYPLASEWQGGVSTPSILLCIIVHRGPHKLNQT